MSPTHTESRPHLASMHEGGDSRNHRTCVGVHGKEGQILVDIVSLRLGQVWAWVQQHWRARN